MILICVDIAIYLIISHKIRVFVWPRFVRQIVVYVVVHITKIALQLALNAMQSAGIGGILLQLRNAGV